MRTRTDLIVNVEALQLSLFTEQEEHILHKYDKKPKLVRYERLQRQLEQNNDDPHKIFIKVKEQPETSFIATALAGADILKSSNVIVVSFSPPADCLGDS